MAWFSRILFAASGISAAQVAQVALLHGHLAEAVADSWQRHGLASSRPLSDKIEPLMVVEIAELLSTWLANPSAGKDAVVWSSVFSRASVIEIRWLSRILMGDLRVGLPQALVEKATEQSLCGGGISVGDSQTRVEVRHPIPIPATKSFPPATSPSESLQSCLSLDLS